MKGSMLDQFSVGDKVEYPDSEGERQVGRILKLHKSGKTGVAEIRNLHGGKKVRRKLNYVTRMR